MFIRVVLFLVISSVSCHPRNVVKSLRVYNGGKWGDWSVAEFCPKGQYAIGFKLKVHNRTMQYCENIIIRAVLIFVEFVVDENPEN
jgi:hypothetical protein